MTATPAHLTASNTEDCFRDVIGLRVTGVLFGALPLSAPDIAKGTKTLVFEDGTGLTFSPNGSFWRESVPDVRRAIGRVQKSLSQTQRELEGVLDLAGQLDGGAS